MTKIKVLSSFSHQSNDSELYAKKTKFVIISMTDFYGHLQNSLLNKLHKNAFLIWKIKTLIKLIINLQFIYFEAFL